MDRLNYGGVWDGLIYKGTGFAYFEEYTSDYELYFSKTVDVHTGIEFPFFSGMAIHHEDAEDEEIYFLDPHRIVPGNL